ncbi:mannose-1-phosphate guanylyltransferase [Tropheryma whipplei]|uniref:Mannose-1-phosphate guanylyltransferase n=1 Tax=Tropheryma whipplei (strain Twist) TaxID=203267 RepID=Q83GE7_TROWT|nr:mannose-1-phosphate guanylyltransferase [Tropheryma whipplei]AAO44453.1 Mannose-1-phosphate guanylyltransferase [Tropheryma whipplei str. Twist]MCO8182383.1 mannose-1-phosphate guanylyltransferase [Tropheryma whipplei]MCO8190153.1 mannose-1-phosphate guanylyltransferase [Tropheryma whipplei]CAD67084.1 putative sugar-1-phosphate nucleotidyltransferase [Tropheryma whipplei TW08/27]
MDCSELYSVIPAGGIGSRLWPLSRAASPKFLHKLTGTETSLLRDTWDRLVPISGVDRIMVVIGSDHFDAVTSQLPELKGHNVILEPEPKDSTAAICLAAAILNTREPDVIIGSFPADHVIKTSPLFQQSVAQAVVAANEGYVVTIAITPTEPATQFGYILCGDSAGIKGAPQVLSVKRFVEKPSQKDADRYLSSGKYLWNAGMFIAKACVLLEQLEKARPDIHSLIIDIANSPDLDSALKKNWPKMPRIAIEYSVAEPCAAEGRMVTVPAKFEWNDAGDFSSIARLNSRGGSDLVILGETSRVLSDSATGIVVSQTDRIISVIGTKDIVVVDTPDSLLVTTKDDAKKVKQIVEALRLSGRDDVL